LSRSRKPDNQLEGNRRDPEGRYAANDITRLWTLESSSSTRRCR
jgi:hypothetical protein